MAGPRMTTTGLSAAIGYNWTVRAGQQCSTSHTKSQTLTGVMSGLWRVIGVTRLSKPCWKTSTI